ncbi:uncharacterized protein JCM6883_002126 [Sporobolomyces salmoneus]|uniref:uncharacterized protein n=1 Tax=Sporobolomyces salmoneus TaxID=183962 RepID=UPI0031786F8A
MLLYHTEVLRPLYVHQGHGSYVTTPQPVKCALLEGLNLKVAIDYQNKRFCLSWDIQSSSNFKPLQIRGGTITIGGAHLFSDRWEIALEGSTFPPGFATSATLYGPKFQYPTHHEAPITIKLAAPGESLVTDFALIASNVTASLLSREPNNVCFFFPRTRQRIWSNETVLRKASSYFETLFSSDFAESTASQSSPSEQPSFQSPLLPYTYDDSDVETDVEKAALVEPDLASKQEEEKGFETFPFKTIRVVDTTYNTYLAVLLWISTRYISFAPLRSQFPDSQSTSEDSPCVQRQKAVQKMKQESKPGLPIPVSPKSVYRLAHFLELSDVQALALEKFKSQLTTQGAIEELYGDVSCSYPEVQAIVLEFVVNNWNSVKSSTGATRIEQKLENGEGNSAMALIGFKLSKKLGERSGSK